MSQNSIFHFIKKGWNCLLFILRSILSGLFVSAVGIVAWTVFLRWLPPPWCIFPMIIVLWIYWKYFSSNRGQKAGSGLGIYYFRAVALSRAIWKWGLFGAFLFVLIVQASFVVTFCFIEFPVEKFTADYKVVDTMPLGVAWAVIILSSVVAGICEETGFRGYMQVPLEKRYGPTRAIIITSIMFMLMHLNHRWAFTILPHIFCASVLLGMLAFRSGSLLPGIIGHSILDIFDYSVWWTDLTGNYKRPTIFKSGVNLHFILWVLILGAALWGFFIVLDRLKKHYTNVSSPSPRDRRGQSLPLR